MFSLSVCMCKCFDSRLLTRVKKCAFLHKLENVNSVCASLQTTLAFSMHAHTHTPPGLHRYTPTSMGVNHRSVEASGEERGEEEGGGGGGRNRGGVT